MSKNKKKVIKTESELKKWVIDNYRKLGFSKIIRKDIGICPDLIMMRDGKEVRIELETMSSNFLRHKHDLNKVDEVISAINDIEIGKPITEIHELEFQGNPNTKVTLSIEEDVYNRFQKFCEENAIMLSKKLELTMEKIMKEDERK